MPYSIPVYYIVHVHLYANVSKPILVHSVSNFVCLPCPMYIWSAVATLTNYLARGVLILSQSAANQDLMHCTDQVGYWLYIVSSWNCIAG